MSGDIDKLSASLDIDELMKWADEITGGNSPDGTKLEFREDGVYLTVYPPDRGGSQRDPEELVRDIIQRNIQDVELTKVRQAAREMTGIPVRIAPPRSEAREDASVVAGVSRDKMEAYITVTPAKGGKELTRQDIESALAAKNIVYGIRDDVIQTALTLKHPDTLTVAVGSKPIDGENAVIEYKFDTDVTRGRPTETVDGRADYYNLNLIQNVEKGQVLAVKKPATPGVPGRTVTGEEIPAKPGKDIHLSVGKNVDLLENNTVAVAAAKGHVTLTGNKIQVSTVYEVNGDVDFNTGNVEFNGSVIIKGSIREGFKVVADGDVEVMNTIADGIVECTGTVKVKNGIIGKKSNIKAGGNVITRFIENATVEAGGDVLVGEAIMHSRVSARKSVIVGGRGVIVGGVIRAGEEINCKVAGSSLATATELEAGINPALRQELTRLTKEKEAKEADLEKAEKAFRLLNHIKQTQGRLPSDKEAILARVSSLKAQLEHELEVLNDSINDIQFQIEQSERGKIMVQGVIHAGVKVTIGTVTMHIHDDYKFACLRKVGEEIKISPYS